MLMEQDQLTSEHLEILAWDFGLGFRGEELCKRLRNASPGLRVESEYITKILKENDGTFNKMVEKASYQRTEARRQARSESLSAVNKVLERASVVLADKFESHTAILEELDPFDEEDNKKMKVILHDMRPIARDMAEWTDRRGELFSIHNKERERILAIRAERSILLKAMLGDGANSRNSVHRGADDMLNSEYGNVMPDLIEDPVAEVLALVNSGILNSGLLPEKPIQAKLMEPKVELEDAF